MGLKMNRQTTSHSISVSSLLGIVLVVLKLMGYITWSWWWVTAPFWAPFAIVMVAILVVIIYVYRRRYISPKGED